MATLAPSPKGATGRTHLELVTRQVAAYEAELVEVRQKLAELPSREHSARVAAISEAPTQKGARPGGGAYDLVAERKTLEAREVELIKDLTAGREVQALRAREQALKDLAGPIAAGEALRERERSLWQGAGALYGPLIKVINEIHAVAEERDQLLLRYEQVLRDCEDPALRLRGEAAFSQVIAPFPADVPEALDYLLKATVDPHGAGYREHAVRIDHENVLVSLTPDLRGLNTVANLSGRADKARSVRDGRPSLTVLPAR